MCRNVGAKPIASGVAVAMSTQMLRRRHKVSPQPPQQSPQPPQQPQQQPQQPQHRRPPQGSHGPQSSHGSRRSLLLGQKSRALARGRLQAPDVCTPSSFCRGSNLAQSSSAWRIGSPRCPQMCCTTSLCCACTRRFAALRAVSRLASEWAARIFHIFRIRAPTRRFPQ